eukprot:1180446-Prorocentrum_minimum.AAC.1
MFGVYADLVCAAGLQPPLHQRRPPRGELLPHQPPTFGHFILPFSGGQPPLHQRRPPAASSSRTSHLHSVISSSILVGGSLHSTSAAPPAASSSRTGHLHLVISSSLLVGNLHSTSVLRSRGGLHGGLHGGLEGV